MHCFHERPERAGKYSLSTRPLLADSAGGNCNYKKVNWVATLILAHRHRHATWLLPPGCDESIRLPFEPVKRIDYRSDR